VYQRNNKKNKEMEKRMSQAASFCAEERVPARLKKTDPELPPQIQPCWWYRVKEMNK
jgi:hypothetical protein